MDIVKIGDKTLDINSIYSQVTAHSAGAVSLFVGTTRDNFEGKRVITDRTRKVYGIFVEILNFRLGCST